MNSNLSPPQSSQSDAPPLRLRWTEHPLIDAALAGLCVFADVRQPSELLPEHLQEFQDWAEEAYFSPNLGGWVSVAFTSNFLNPSWDRTKKLKAIQEVLSSYKNPNLLPEPCAIFPELQAQQRIARDRMPMLLGRTPINFYSEGKAGVPLSGQAISVLQGLAVATPLVSGRMLVIDADDKALLLRLVRNWQGDWLKQIDVSLQQGNKTPSWSAPRTRLIEGLRSVMRLRSSHVNLDPTEQEELPVFKGGVTIYHLTNSGQGPDAQIYTLERPAINFLRLAEQKFANEWHTLLNTKRYAADKKYDPEYGFKNSIDEDLFGLPTSSSRFIRRYFWPIFKQALQQELEENKKQNKISKSSKKSAKAELEEAQNALQKLVQQQGLKRFWELVGLFLQEVIGMDKERIAEIDALGQRLGDWIIAENDKKMFREIQNAQKYGSLRHVLLSSTFAKVGKEHELALPKEERGLIVTMQQYLKIFTEADELAPVDFYLARDLLKMRLIEYLYDNGFFSKNQGDPEFSKVEITNNEGEEL